MGEDDLFLLHGYIYRSMNAFLRHNAVFRMIGQFDLSKFMFLYKLMIIDFWMIETIFENSKIIVL